MADQAKLKVGDRIPDDVSFQTLRDGAMKTLTKSEIFDNQKVSILMFKRLSVLFFIITPPPPKKNKTTQHNLQRFFLLFNL